MKRREFLLHSGRMAGAIAASRVWGPAVLAAEVRGRTHIAWQRDTPSGLFVGVAADGTPLVTREQPGLLAGSCRLADEAPEQATRLDAQQSSATHGPLRLELRHGLRASGLHALPADVKTKMVTDIGSLFGKPSQRESP